MWPDPLSLPNSSEAILSLNTQVVCVVFQRVTQGVERSRVRGLGFDATCSLVVLDQNFQPLPVTRDGKIRFHLQEQQTCWYC